LQRIVLFHLLLTKLKLTRTPIVWTVHNVRPHEEMHPLVTMALRRFDRQVQTRIVLNKATAEDSAFGTHSFSVIPHGHYLPTVNAAGQTDLEPSSDYLFFGLIRPYKNVSALLNAFIELKDENLTLRIAGLAQPVTHGAALAASAKNDSRVKITLNFLSDDALVQAIRATKLVVLPYSEMNNSGAALLALSVGRPVLVPENVATRELQSEFGQFWVQLYDGELTGAILKASQDLVRRAPTEQSPDLSARDWHGIAEQHHAIYATVSSSGRISRNS